MQIGENDTDGRHDTRLAIDTNLGCFNSGIQQDATALNVVTVVTIKGWEEVYEEHASQPERVAIICAALFFTS